MNKSEIIQKLKIYKRDAANRYGIKHIGLFGSYAIEKANETSDIDIIVDIDTPDLFILSHIKEELEELFGKHVDIVRNHKKINPYLKKRIDERAVYV